MIYEASYVVPCLSWLETIFNNGRGYKLVFLPEGVGKTISKAGKTVSDLDSSQPVSQHGKTGPLYLSADNWLSLLTSLQIVLLDYVAS